MIQLFNYHKTNCFFVDNNINQEILAIDAGWPCTLYEYKRNLKDLNISFNDIKYCIVTHFHMDHAGLFGEFQSLGIQCFVLDFQINKIDDMEKIIQKNKEYIHYAKIDKNKQNINR